MNQVATIRPGKSVLIDMASKYGMEPAAFEATVRATCMPGGKELSTTREQFAAFLLVAKEYGLNPLTKEIYAFPDKKGGITPIVGIDGWANIVNSHPAFDGMDFNDVANAKGEVEAITCRMHRKDRSHPIEATEYLAECRGQTDPWRRWPRRMLRHKAMIQAARYAFGFAGIYDPDEADRIAGDMAKIVRPSAVDLETRLKDIKAPPPPAPAHDPDTGEIADTGSQADEEPAPQEAHESHVGASPVAGGEIPAGAVIAPQPKGGEVAPSASPPGPNDDDFPGDEIADKARQKAMQGRKVFDRWYGGLAPVDTADLAAHMPGLMAAAKAADGRG